MRVKWNHVCREECCLSGLMDCNLITSCFVAYLFTGEWIILYQNSLPHQTLTFQSGCLLDYYLFLVHVKLGFIILNEIKIGRYCPRQRTAWCSWTLGFHPPGRTWWTFDVLQRPSPSCHRSLHTRTCTHTRTLAKQGGCSGMWGVLPILRGDDAAERGMGGAFTNYTTYSLICTLAGPQMAMGLWVWTGEVSGSSSPAWSQPCLEPWTWHMWGSSQHRASCSRGTSSQLVTHGWRGHSDQGFWHNPRETEKTRSKKGCC